MGKGQQGNWRKWSNYQGELRLQKEVLVDVGSFDPGAIGAEDVMMDHRIRLAGYRLWSDGSAVMWHRRRGSKE